MLDMFSFTKARDAMQVIYPDMTQDAEFIHVSPAGGQPRCRYRSFLEAGAVVRIEAREPAGASASAECVFERL